ncbi:MAG TPA: hypothetical protein GX747_00115 [Tenericutes bacterium]|nr:hypothetical protein [Mycoplasmatota bacterium]
MNQEITGIIDQLIDEESGYIKGNDGNLYYFSTLNFINPINRPIKNIIGLEVNFKSNYIPALGLYTASLIEFYIN